MNLTISLMLIKKKKTDQKNIKIFEWLYSVNILKIDSKLFKLIDNKDIELMHTVCSLSDKFTICTVGNKVIC